MRSLMPLPSALLSSASFVPPTSEELVSALFAGDDTVERQRARFRQVDASACVPRLLVQAIDPLLLTVILGQDLAVLWVPPLERYYAQVRRASPATFLDFDRAWELQRRRWRSLVESAAEGQDARPAGPPADAVLSSRGPDGPGAALGRQPARGRAGRRGAAAAGAGSQTRLPEGDSAGMPASVPSAAATAAGSLGSFDDTGFEPDPEDELPPEPDDPPPHRSPADGDQLLSSADPGAVTSGEALPRAGRHGLAIAAAARRPDFDLVTVFDACLSELDAEPHWEAFRFGAASLQRGR